MDAKKRIEEIMKERDLNPYKLSKICGIPQSTLSNMFKKTTQPTLSTIESICNGLDITINQFFSDDSDLVNLNEEQKELLKNWGMLTPEQKEAFLQLMRVM